jgi:hypothetical protein
MDVVRAVSVRGANGAGGAGIAGGVGRESSLVFGFLIIMELFFSHVCQFSCLSSLIGRSSSPTLTLCVSLTHFPCFSGSGEGVCGMRSGVRGGI